MVTLDVPGYRQSRNYSCGFAAVLMVIRYYQIPWTGESIFETLGTARDGTGQTSMVDVLRQAGLSVNLRYDMGFERIVSSINSDKILISYLEDEDHWLVLYGYGRAPKRVFAADPEPGKECEYLWSEYGERLGDFAMVCSVRTTPKVVDEHMVALPQLSLRFDEEE